MVNTLWPVNAVSGQPSYNGRMLRQVGSTKYAGARQGRPFGTRSGVRPGTPDTFVGVSSTQWVVGPHAGVLDVHTPAQVGPYEYAVEISQFGDLVAADASDPRVDILYAQVADPSESDGTTTPGVVIGYQAGVAAVSPVQPATPARSMLLATINVPKAGGGSPSVIRQAPTLTLAGTPYQVRSDTERDALLSVMGSSVAAPLWVEHVGGARAGVVERHRGGSTWEVLTGLQPLTDFAYATGWAGYGSGFPGARWSRSPSGLVTLEGLIKRSGGTISSAAESGTIATLPPEARPSGGTLIAVTMSSFSTTGVVRLNVGSNGVVSAVSVTGLPMNWTTDEFVSVTGVSYRAAS